jgi:dTDP-4-dehydrorhamnose 3,5-epimerase
MIKDVFIKPLKVFSDERGKVMHMLRADEPFFKQFGEVYFSLVNPGFVKGWKRHLKKTQHFAVPIGNIKLVIYDDRKDSSSNGKIQEISVGTENYQLVRVPAGVWYSFKAIGEKIALLVNCADSPHDPDEVEALSPFSKKIPYNWSLKIR